MSARISENTQTYITFETATSTALYCRAEDEKNE